MLLILKFFFLFYFICIVFRVLDVFILCISENVMLFLLISFMYEINYIFMLNIENF